jgi:protein O-GlcNAc transferase
MNYQKFLEQLPSFYENWEQDSVYPKSAQFQTVIEQVKGMTTANVMQLLNFAVDCMEPGEIYCEIGCFQGATLIGALLNHPEQVAYAVDNFSRFDEHGENLEKLIDNLTRFGIEEQVVFCEQDFEEFFWELREVNFEEKIGVYFYDGAHDYRSQILGLLLIKPFLADRALIIVDDSNRSAVHQANWDFIASHPHCQMLFDLPTRGNGDRTFWNGIQVLSWDVDRTYIYNSTTLKDVRKKAIIQSIYKLQFGSDRQILESIRKDALEFQHNELYKEAEEKYKQFLKWENDDFQVWYNIGLLYYATEQYEKSLKALLQALRIDKSQAVLYHSLGMLYEKIDRLSEALDAYQVAIAIDPMYIDAYNNLGNLLYQDGQFKEAEAVYRQAISVSPEHYGTYLNLGNVLIANYQIDEAIGALTSGIELSIDRAELLENLRIAQSFKENLESYYHFYLKNIYHKVFKNRPEEVVKILHDGIQKYPQESEFHYYLIQTLIASGDIEKAILRSDEALRLIPSSLTLKVQRLQLLPIIYKSQSEIEVYRQRYIQSLQNLTQTIRLDTSQEKQDALDAIGRINNFYLAYQGYNDLDLQRQYGQLVHQVMAANYPEWVKNKSMPSLTSQEKIRVGYISSQMGPYRLGELILGWLRHCDRSQFEVYCYYWGETVNDLTKKFQEYSDYFYHIPGDLKLICTQVIADNLHILVFIEIGLSSKSTQIASLRLAPIQCTTWAHPVTSGLPTIDYFLSSDLMEPDNGQEHYSERLIRLPKIGICYTPPSIPIPSKTRSDFNLRDNSIVYLTCQALFKYLPQYDYIVARIAQQVPQSQFVFISSPSALVTQQFQERLQTTFAAFDLNSNNYCVFLPRLSESDYLNVNLLSDIFLDSLGWSGGVTTLKAIACNLPIVTCPRELMRSRHSSGILKALELSDLVVEAEEQYIELAVSLGQNTNRRHDMLDCMLISIQKLYQDKTCVKALESFYRESIVSYKLKIEHII